MNIKDGKGRGYEAMVNQKNRVGVSSVTHTGEAQAAAQGKSFIAHSGLVANSITLGDSASTGAYVMTIKNDSASETLIVSNVFASASTAGVLVLFDRNPTLGSLTFNSSVAAVNTDFRSGITADVSCNIWNESSNGIGGITEGSLLNSFVMARGLTVVPVDESFILGKDDVLAVLMTRASTTDEVAFGVRFHLITNEEVEDFI